MSPSPLIYKGFGSGGVAELADATDSKSVSACRQVENSKRLTACSEPRGAQNGAQADEGNSELELVVGAWASLPAPIKVGIIAMINATRQ